MKSTNDPRQCYYMSPLQCDEHGYIPSLVTEHEAGYSPMTGQGKFAAPWYWGKTLEHAQQTCDRVNKQRFNLTPKAALRIVASSMAAGKVRDYAND